MTGFSASPNDAGALLVEDATLCLGNPWDCSPSSALPALPGPSSRHCLQGLERLRTLLSLAASPHLHSTWNTGDSSNAVGPTSWFLLPLRDASAHWLCGDLQRPELLRQQLLGGWQPSSTPMGLTFRYQAPLRGS